MISTLMVSRNKHFFAGIEDILVENNMTLEWSDSGENALLVILEKSIDLLIIDEKLSDMTGKQCIEKVVMKNPMIQCVVASSLTHKEFHEEYEGYGVLMQFSVSPDKKQAQQLLDHMKQISNLQAK